MEKNYNSEKNEFENSFKKKINQYQELLNINTIIYNTYNKSKENYFHNINIINLLINYYERGNETIKVMKDNEDFMETIKQKEYEININFNKSFVLENNIYNKYNDMILSEDKNRTNTSPGNKNKNKTFITNIDNNKDFQSNLNNNNIVKNLNQNFINFDDKSIFQDKESNLNNNIMINNQIQNPMQIYDDNKIIQNKESNKNEISNNANNNLNDIFYNNYPQKVGLNNNNNYDSINMVNHNNNKFNPIKPKVINKNIYQKNIKNTINKSKNNSVSKKSFEEKK